MEKNLKLLMLWKTGEIRALFPRKDKNVNYQYKVYSGKCESYKDFIGETISNKIARCTE